MTKVLVTGATGQDAYYLMPKLAHLGYEVFGMIRSGDPDRVTYLHNIPFLTLVQGDLLDYPSLVAVATEIYPDIIINTAGLTSPSACWGLPELAAKVNGIGAIRLLDILSNPTVKYIQFGSIAEFGPYGASKLYAQKMMDDFRERSFATTTIRFAGHHSPRRSPLFFSRRVSQAAAQIAAGQRQELELGPLTRSQDWGYAPEFMDAVIEILSMEPGTYTVATGDPHRLDEYVNECFRVVGLDWRNYVKGDSFAAQPTDVESLSAEPDARLSWQPKTSLKDLARIMVEADLEAIG